MIPPRILEITNFSNLVINPQEMSFTSIVKCWSNKSYFHSWLLLPALEKYKRKYDYMVWYMHATCQLLELSPIAKGKYEKKSEHVDWLFCIIELKMMWIYSFWQFTSYFLNIFLQIIITICSVYFVIKTQAPRRLPGHQAADSHVKQE